MLYEVITLGNAQTGMNHGAEAAVGDVPLAAALNREIDGAGRAEIDTDTTTLTPDGIDLKPFVDGAESAEGETGSSYNFV